MEFFPVAILFLRLIDKLTKPGNQINQSFQLLATVLALITGIFFTGFGISILTGLIKMPNDDGPIMKIFGGLLVIYGIFRLIRVYFKYKSYREE